MIINVPGGGYHFYPPEAELVMAAKPRLQRYIASQTRLGRDIRRSAIYAALHVEGVQRGADVP